MDGPIVRDADVPQGADPRLAYLAGRELIDSAGNRIRLDADYNMIARAGDEYLAVRQCDLGVFVDVLDAEGAVIETSRTTGEVVLADSAERLSKDEAVRKAYLGED